MLVRKIARGVTGQQPLAANCSTRTRLIAMPSRRALDLLGPQARLLRTGALRPYTNTPIYIIYGTGPEAQWLADQLPLP